MPQWLDQGPCVGYPTDLFFSEGEGDHTQIAKKICAQCTVIEKCLNFALQMEKHFSPPFGVFGGKSAAQRKLLKLCRYADCTNTVKGYNAYWCSEEHETLHKRRLRETLRIKQNKNGSTAQTFYKQGSISGSRYT